MVPDPSYDGVDRGRVRCKAWSTQAHFLDDHVFQDAEPIIALAALIRLKDVENRLSSFHEGQVRQFSVISLPRVGRKYRFNYFSDPCCCFGICQPKFSHSNKVARSVSAIHPRPLKAACPQSSPFRPFRLRPNIAIPPANRATRNRTLLNDEICPNIVRASVTELVDVSLQRSRRRVRVRSPAVGNSAHLSAFQSQFHGS